MCFLNNSLLQKLTSISAGTAHLKPVIMRDYTAVLKTTCDQKHQKLGHLPICDQLCMGCNTVEWSTGKLWTLLGVFIQP